MIYVTEKEVKKRFAQHLMMHCFYSEAEADLAVSDFPDPYSNCYLGEEYVGPCVIDGIEYSKCASYTNLARVMGMYDIPDFYFYTYYRSEDLAGGTVGDSMRARKLYQLDDLNKSDFPEFHYF